MMSNAVFILYCQLCVMLIDFDCALVAWWHFSWGWSALQLSLHFRTFVPSCANLRWEKVPHWRPTLGVSQWPLSKSKYVAKSSWVYLWHLLSCLRLSANQNCALLALREMIVKMQVVFLYLLYLYATTFPLSVLSFTFPCAYFFVCISVAGFSSAKSTDDWVKGQVIDWGWGM